MTCCIEVETIQHIKDTQDVNGTPRDVISEALAVWNSYGTYTGAVHDRIWMDYRLRMIGSCDVDRWVQLLGDRLGALAEVYVGRLDMQATVITPDMGGTITRVYGSRKDDTSSVTEDMPDTSTPLTDTYLYPSTRGKSETNKGSQTDTEHDSGSTAEHLKNYYRDLKDPLDDMMRDISEFWLNRWV